MNELIPIRRDEINGEVRQTVDARELHAFLGVKSEFRNWIKNRIEQFGFVQGVDFVAGKFLPGSEQVDYFLTLDMGKELSMVERTAKGKEARLYFLECERRALAAKPAHSIPQTYAEALQLAADQARRIEQQAQQIEAAKPAVEFHERVGVAEDCHTLDEAAKILRVGPYKLREWLRAHGFMRRDGTPMQEYINRGYFRVIEKTIQLPHGWKLYAQTYVTGKGLIWLQRQIDHAPLLA